MSSYGRYLSVSTLLMVATVPASRMLARRYGTRAGRRFGAGMAAQMLLFITALAPFGGRATWAVVRLTCSIQTPAQVAGLLLLDHRRRRR
jgi:hypothetical protein